MESITQRLTVPILSPSVSGLPIAELAAVMRGVQRSPLAFSPWRQQYPYIPQVGFSIAYDREGILLQYEVYERFARARYAQSNDPVYKDSCVEFFIAPGEDQSYYNFEFNCAGTCLLGYGAGRGSREALSAELIGRIDRQTLILPAVNGQSNIGWELTARIPWGVFVHHPGISFSERHCRANFYKCGDELPDPHYLAWNNIQSERPDFHLPAFFGSLSFT